MLVSKVVLSFINKIVMNNIKNIQKIGLGLAFSIALSLPSCTEDYLDKAPYGVFTADQVDANGVESLMAGAYSGLEGHFFGNFESFSGPTSNWVFDLRSDDAYKGGGGIGMEAYLTEFELANLFSDNPVNTNKWRNNYYAIARVNNAINAISDVNPSNVNELLGELRLLRGHFYFDLVRIFNRMPYITENDNPVEVSPSQYTRDQIKQFIWDDFMFAYQNVAVEQSQIGRANRYVAASYLAKLALERKDYANVIKYCDEVIASGKYELYDNFLDMSKVEYNNRKESIFAIQFSTASNNLHINWGNLLNTTYSDGNLFGNGDDFYIASQNLANAFRTDANGLPYLDDFNSQDVTSTYAGNVDPRLDFTLGRNGFPFRGHIQNDAWSRDKATYGEYSGKKCMIDPSSADMVIGFPWGASALNFNIIRYADLLLWKAEALVESGSDLEEARQIVNLIRLKAQRSVDLTYAPVDIDPTKANYKVEEYPSSVWNADFAKKAVRMERRLELAMEGHRWFDLVRWGVATEVVNKYYQEEQDLRPWMKGAQLSSDEIYLAIPKEEVDKSGGLYN